MTEISNREKIESCPWCTSSERKPWGKKKNNFQSVVCGACGLIYVKNRYNTVGLKQYYKNYLSNAHQADMQMVENRSAMYRVEHDYIIQYISDGKILDVGCSGGYFLDCFDSNAFICRGVEFGDEAAEEAGKKFHVYKGDFNVIEIQEKFDLIIFRGVIEHIPYPKSYLKKAISLLNNKGLIYITSTPNSDAFCCGLFKENWNQHQPEAHLMHFNKNHFDQYFGEKELTLVDYKTFYKETPYCSIENDILKVARAIKMKKAGKRVNFKSPAFYENMMSLIYQKNA